jgi:hypothetical protein
VTTRLGGGGGRDESATVVWALDPKAAVDGSESVRQPDQAAPIRACASHTIVTHTNRERAILDPRAWSATSRATA